MIWVFGKWKEEWRVDRVEEKRDNEPKDVENRKIKKKNKEWGNHSKWTKLTSPRLGRFTKTSKIKKPQQFFCVKTCVKNKFNK